MVPFWLELSISGWRWSKRQVLSHNGDMVTLDSRFTARRERLFSVKVVARQSHDELSALDR